MTYFRTLSVLTVLLLSLVNTANGALILQTNANGDLTGVSNLDVNGTLYDVTFSEQSCAALYSGCDQAADFVFATRDEALSAAQALMDMVFTGQYDDQPDAVFGCNHSTNCSTLIPYGEFVLDLVRGVFAANGFF